MASLQCQKTTEKGLNQGYYGGSSFGQNTNWGSKASKKESKYQGAQNGYAMSYSESERYSQIQVPTHGMSESQTAYGVAEAWNEHGQSYGSHKPQNGNAMLKTQVHGRGNGYGSHSSNGIAQIQAHGSNNHPSPGKQQGLGYGYGVCPPRNQKTSGGMDHRFSSHTNHEITEAYYGYDETNGRGKYANNGMGHSAANQRGKQSGQGNGFIMPQPQAYGPGRNMAYGKNGTEACEYSETYYFKESDYNGGGRGFGAGKGDNPVKGLLRKIKDGISGKNSCSDTDSDDDDYGRRKACISKAI